MSKRPPPPDYSTAPASWIRTPPPPKARKLGIWPRQRPAPDPLRCEAITATGSNAGKQCYNSWSMRFEGVGYCDKHHPVRMAEIEARRIYRLITGLEQMGFTVRATGRAS
jgi:hypothetical protein